MSDSTKYWQQKKKGRQEQIILILLWLKVHLLVSQAPQNIYI